MFRTFTAVARSLAATAGVVGASPAFSLALDHVLCMDRAGGATLAPKDGRRRNRRAKGDTVEKRRNDAMSFDIGAVLSGISDVCDCSQCVGNVS
jgi:hypothetical protein